MKKNQVYMFIKWSSAIQIYLSVLVYYNKRTLSYLIEN
jgi:hypothetical protein